ncbi:alkaline phosphatase-like [Ornithodoros turicata]|uniref:alkaline phosphatase-like n=1 Tax=Ornithodoros turicata TaxID=34597 RepID=UPI00313963A6
MWFVRWLFLFVAAGRCWSENFTFPVPDRSKELNRTHWRDLAANEIQSRLAREPTKSKARNVVIFLGDGMGPSTVTAARIYKGQRRSKQSGEEGTLVWDNFPHVSLSRTYGLDVQTSDSANTATAYLCGVKANYQTLGVDHRVKSGECHSDKSTHVSSIMTWAQKEGLWTGIVTTTRVTHATPAGTYAHSGHRWWEASVPKKCSLNDTKDIAQQLVQDSPGSNFRVILGGGRRNFINSTEKDEEGLPGIRKDGKNLIDEWKKSKTGKGNHTYIWNRKQLLSVNPLKTDYLLGLVANDHLPYVLEQENSTTSAPTLQEMAETAIKILKRSPKGFVLLVEGGLIDRGHHINKASYALEEAVGLDESVSSALELLDVKETLMVVTADHSHVFTMGGYPERGKDILGVSSFSDVNHYPVTTLAYGNGPGYNETKANYTDAETTRPGFSQRSAFPLRRDTHGGEEVAVYAVGPWAHLFSGVHDQSYIPHAIAYAACIGQFSGARCHTATESLKS